MFSLLAELGPAHVGRIDRSNLEPNGFGVVGPKLRRGWSVTSYEQSKASSTGLPTNVDSINVSVHLLLSRPAQPAWFHGRSGESAHTAATQGPDPIASQDSAGAVATVVEGEEL